MSESQEVDLCYICMEPEDAMQHGFVINQCNCKNMRIHFICLITQIRNQFPKCGACLKKMHFTRFDLPCSLTYIAKFGGMMREVTHDRWDLAQSVPAEFILSHITYDGHKFIETYDSKTYNIIKRSRYLIKNKSHYIVDTKHGLQELWKTTKKGTHYLSYSIEYNNNKLHGSYKTFYPNGQIDIDTTYHNSLKHGTYTRFYENGQIMQSTTYNLGSIHGSFTSFYPNGQPDIECNYKLGKLDGNYKKWKVNGILQSQHQYHNGKLLYVDSMHSELLEFGTIC